MQKLLHAVGVLCIDYYEAFQRKKRANSWSDCHSRIECLDSKSAIKNMSGFRACNFPHSSFASGRRVFSSCGADPSRAKNGLSAPTGVVVGPHRTRPRTAVWHLASFFHKATQPHAPAFLEIAASLKCVERDMYIDLVT
jgi:hypothetical protein